MDAAPCVKPMAMSDGDADGDGVPDSKGQVPNTPAGAVVDAMVVRKDSDGDGVLTTKTTAREPLKAPRFDPSGCEIAGNMMINVTADHRFRQRHAEAGHESRA